MKVVMLCEFYNESLDYQEVMLAKYYVTLGHDVVVITGSTTSVHDYIAGMEAPSAHTVEQGRYAKVYRVPVRITLLKKILVYNSIRRIVEDEHPDLLYFHDIIPNMLETLPYLLRNPAACALMDYHADFSNSGATWLSRLVLHRLSRRLILKFIRPRLSAILPIVPGSQRFLADLYGIPDGETELFPLGVDINRVEATCNSDARITVRRSLGISDDALVVFTGGKLTPLKRTEQVLRAVTMLDDPRVHVIVIGNVTADPDYDAALRSAAGTTAHFVGWQDSDGVYRYQAAADVAVFPFSQSVLWQQSIGMGLPLVVGEGSGGGRARQDVSYMNRGNIHVLDPVKDAVLQIAAFLAACRTDPTILSSMSAAARDVTRTLLDYGQLVRRTIDITNAHRQSVGAAPVAVDARSAGQTRLEGSTDSSEALAT